MGKLRRRSARSSGRGDRSAAPGRPGPAAAPRRRRSGGRRRRSRPRAGTRSGRCSPRSSGASPSPGVKRTAPKPSPGPAKLLGQRPLAGAEHVDREVRRRLEGREPPRLARRRPEDQRRLERDAREAVGGDPERPARRHRGDDGHPGREAAERVAQLPLAELGQRLPRAVRDGCLASAGRAESMPDRQSPARPRWRSAASASRSRAATARRLSGASGCNLRALTTAPPRKPAASRPRRTLGGKISLPRSSRACGETRSGDRRPEHAARSRTRTDVPAREPRPDVRHPDRAQGLRRDERSAEPGREARRRAAAAEAEGRRAGRVRTASAAQDTV